MPRFPRAEAWLTFWPQFLPDGRNFLFTVADLEGSEGGIHVGSLDDPDNPRRLLPVISRASYAEPGWLLFWQEGVVRAMAFDAATLQFRKATLRPAHGVGMAHHLAYGRFAAAGADLLVYQPGGASGGDTELALLDREGHDLSVVGPRAEYYVPRLSHDGRHVAVDITELRGPESPYGDIWTMELRRGARTRITRSNVNASKPIWTPDDASVIFRMNPDLYIRDASAVSEQRLLFESDESKSPQDVSPNGRYLLFTRNPTEEDLWVLDLESGDAEPWIATDYAETGSRFSPDGRWVAYRLTTRGSSRSICRASPRRESGSWSRPGAAAVRSGAPTAASCTLPVRRERDRGRPRRVGGRPAGARRAAGPVPRAGPPVPDPRAVRRLSRRGELPGQPAGDTGRGRAAGAHPELDRGVALARDRV